MPCVCDPPERHDAHYVQWIGTVFSVCAYTDRDIAAFLLGLANIGFWLFAQAPQLYQNYKNSSSESLSGLFLTLWLVGDITNFIGCILTNQPKVQLFTSIYFLIMDVVTLAQYAYYYFKNKKSDSSVQFDNVHLDDRRESLAQQRSGSKRLYAVLFVLVVASALPASPVSFMQGAGQGVGVHGHLSAASASSALSSFSHPFSESAATISAALRPTEAHLGQFTRSNRVLLSTGLDTTEVDPDAEICNEAPKLSDAAYIAGCVSAWVSGLLYFWSRFPQIYRNYVRKSTEGLSLSMFVMAILGNTCYGISIVLPTGAEFSDNNFFNNTLPYLIGSLGTNVTALVILYQAWKYRGRPPLDEDMDAIGLDAHTIAAIERKSPLIANRSMSHQI